MADPRAIIQRALAEAQSGRLGPAIGALERLVQKKGAPAEAHHFLGMLLAQEGRIEPALLHLERAAAMAPGRAQFHSNLANVLVGAGRRDEAERRYRLAIEADGQYAPAHTGLAGLWIQQGRLCDAEAEARIACSLAPESAEAVANYASALILGGRAGEAARVLGEAISRLGPSIALDTLLVAARSYDEVSTPEQILEANRRLGHLHAAAARHFSGSLPPLGRRVRAAGPLRVGYLSADFHDHPVGMFIAPALASDEGVEVYCYDLATEPEPEPEAGAERRGAGGAVWRGVRGLTDAALTTLVRGDGLDLLVELGGHTIGNRQTALAARMAPVQASYLGYPATTGNPAIGARLVDSRSDPPGAERWCTERLVRLDPCAWCYSAPADAPGVTPREPDAPIVFASFNNLAKTGPAVIEAWAELLRRVGGSRLALKNSAFVDAATRERIVGEFAARGVEPGRILALPPTRDAQGHLAAYAGVDIALDTSPYAGTTTTCEALWMGVPVVTLAGTLHAARVGVSLLGAVGLEELVAPTRDAYVEVAAQLAADRERLAALRASLRDRMRASPLMDAAGFRARLHAAYADLVRETAGGPG